MFAFKNFQSYLMGSKVIIYGPVSNQIFAEKEICQTTFDSIGVGSSKNWTWDSKQEKHGECGGRSLV